jgi:hypothetical protein
MGTVAKVQVQAAPLCLGSRGALDFSKGKLALLRETLIDAQEIQNGISKKIITSMPLWLVR